MKNFSFFSCIIQKFFVNLQRQNIQFCVTMTLGREVRLFSWMWEFKLP